MSKIQHRKHMAFVEKVENKDQQQESNKNHLKNTTYCLFYMSGQ